jgi:hypothetical protein
LTAVSNTVITVGLSLSIFVSSAYALGRIHQWYRHGAAREVAYRDGYDKASHTMFGLVTPEEEVAPELRLPTEPEAPARTSPTPDGRWADGARTTNGGRASVRDRLVGENRRRMAPRRVGTGRSKPASGVARASAGGRP